MAFFKSLLKPSLLFLVLLFAFFLTSSNLHRALALSGGAVGGSSFSSGGGSGSSSTMVVTSSSSSSSCSGDCDSDSDITPLYYIIGGIVLVIAIVGFCGCWSNRRRGNSVLMLQVGLLGKARVIQRDLTQIALTSNTATYMDFHKILLRATSALLQNPTYCISGYSFVDEVPSEESLEEHFNKLSNKERQKFDIESLVNVDNVRVQRPFVPEVNKLGQEYIVVTILVAANGAYTIPVIKDSKSLEESLQYLGRSIAMHKLKAVHVLWTPQNEHDALVEEELRENYPLLRPISGYSPTDTYIQNGVA